MIERFHKSYIKYIKECAEAIHSIENGTANQRTINEMFYPSDFFTFLEGELENSGISLEENLIDIEAARHKALKGYYRALVGTVQYTFPEADKAYLPFLIADVL